MKSLMKIIRRYVVSAAVLVLTVAFFNIAMLYFIGWQSLQKYGESRLYAGEQLETVVGEFSAADQGTAENTVQYQLSEQGFVYGRCFWMKREMWSGTGGFLRRSRDPMDWPMLQSSAAGI